MTLLVVTIHLTIRDQHKFVYQHFANTPLSRTTTLLAPPRNNTLARHQVSSLAYSNINNHKQTDVMKSRDLGVSSTEPLEKTPVTSDGIH